MSAFKEQLKERTRMHLEAAIYLSTQKNTNWSLTYSLSTWWRPQRKHSWEYPALFQRSPNKQIPNLASERSPTPTLALVLPALHEITILLHSFPSTGCLLILTVRPTLNHNLIPLNVCSFHLTFKAEKYLRKKPILHFIDKELCSRAYSVATFVCLFAVL